MEKAVRRQLDVRLTEMWNGILCEGFSRSSRKEAEGRPVVSPATLMTSWSKALYRNLWSTTWNCGLSPDRPGYLGQ